MSQNETCIVFWRLF